MINDHFGTLVLLKAVRQLDAFGGEVVTWSDSVYFNGIVTNATSTAEAVHGDKSALQSKFVIATDIGVGLKQNDRVRDEVTKKVYRVTSDATDMRIPDFACMQFEQVDAEMVRV